VYRIFGLQPQEFDASYQAFLAYVHPDDREAVDAAYTGSLREGKDTYEIEHRIVRKSTGEIRVVHEKCEHIRDASGRIIRSFGMVHDITDRKRMEESLRFTQFAVDHMADAAFWMTDDARIFYVNEAACQALGYSCDDLLKMTVYDIDPAFTQSMWSDNWGVLKAKKSIVFETVHKARDGTVHPVEIRANYLEFGGREYDCAFARDITKRKRRRKRCGRASSGTGGWSRTSRDLILSTGMTRRECSPT
jgi:PAS domain S-box-containing protein